MFQGGKRKTAKEQEQIISEQKEQLKNFKQAVIKITDAGDTAMDILEELEKEQNSFDQSLTHVVEHIKQIREEEIDRTRREEELLDKLTELVKTQEIAARNYGHAVVCAEEEEKQLLTMMEQNKHFTVPTRDINQTAKELEQSAGRMEEELAQMKEFGRQMGVLSLNSAIEAGRMGESGRKFVTASEEVRNFAGKYQEATERVISQVGDMKQKLLEAQEQITHLTGLLKENNIHMAKTTQSFNGCMEQLRAADMQKEVEDCGILLEEWKTAADITKNHEIYFEDTLSYMEQAGESFIKEQESMEQLKEQWKRVQLEVERVR